MIADRSNYEEMESKLAEAEDLVNALRGQEVDAIIGEKRIAMVRLREAEESLRRAKAELEQRVVERTADLAKVNAQLRETIEEQERTWRKLQRSERRLLKAQQIARIGNWEWDVGSDTQWWSDEIYRLLGVEPGQVEPGCESFLSFVHPADREPVRSAICDMLNEKRPCTGEFRILRRDGQERFMHSEIEVELDGQGNAVRIMGTTQDITDRRRVEREMAEARQFAESIVDTVQECLVVLDRQLRVISANRSFQETFGLPPRRIDGRLFYTLGDGQWDIPELREKLRAVLSENTSFEGFELECAVAGSESRSLVLSARPISEPVGDAGMILLAIQDVTAHVQQKRQIEADKRHLELLTEELVVSEERQRRQIAQALHDTIGQSLAFAKRELGVMQKRAPAEMHDSFKQVSEQICDAVERTRNLTFELSPSTLDILGLEAAVEEMAEQFSDCETFACTVRGPGQRIPLTDHVQSLLYRAVRELLVNVAKHAAARSVSILLEQGERDTQVIVQDDGQGFDPSALRADRGKDRGFGLFSIKERLTHLGGSFTIDSAEGRGTKVTLVAPLDIEYRQE